MSATISVTLDYLKRVVIDAKRQGYQEGKDAALDLARNRAANSGDIRLHDLVDAVHGIANPYGSA